jgi:hypothetical protein
MPAELDNMDPEMDQEMDASADMGGDPSAMDAEGGHGDQEGAMAKQELIKLANYATNLQEHIEDDEQLEAWVQSKITIAATNIASVYHYLAYEKKIGEYGDAMESASLSEGQRRLLKARLTEAKEKMKQLKKVQAEKMSEEFTDKSKVGDTFKTKTGVATKTDTGMKHTNTSYHDDGDADEKSGKGIKTHAKAKDAGTKKAEKGNDIKLPKHDKPTYGMKNGEKFDNRKPVDEAKKKGDGNLANNYPPFDKVTKGDVVAGRLGKDQKGGKKTMKEGMSPADTAHYHACKCAECYMEGNLEMASHHKDMCEQYGGTVHIQNGKCHHCHPHINGGEMYECGSGMMYEAAQKTMSRAAKGMMKYGKDGMKALAKAGKEGKDLDKVRDKYDKYDEGSMPMKKVNGKSVPAFAADGKGKNDLSKKKDVKETAAAAMWKNIKETTSYLAEKKKKEKVADEGNEFSGALKKAREEGDTTMTVDGKSIPVKPGKSMSESTEVNRLRELTGRLNVHEKTRLNENDEVNSLRKLSNFLKG